MSLSTPEDCPLTASQLKIVTLVAEGLTHKEIAHQLGLSWSTVRQHAGDAYKRLDVPSAPLAIIACARAGWIDIGGKATNQAGQLVKLERLLVRIARAIERRRERDLTLKQRKYLDAFEEHLQARQPATVRVTADRMSVAFGELCTEAGISIERGRGPSYARHERKAA